MRNILASASLLAPLLGVPTVEAPSDLVFVFLLSGSNTTSLDATELREAQSGHRANIRRLADEGWLLLAGPFAPPRANPRYSGIFVFDVSDVARARELTETDPAVKAGLFELEAHPWRTTSPMRRIPALNSAALTAKAAAGEEPTWDGRAFVLVTVEAPDAAEAALAPLVRDELVLFSGRFGGERAGSALFLLDAETLEAARELLEFADPESAIAWTLHPWYGAACLVELPRLAKHADAPTFEIVEIPAEGRMAAFRPAFARSTSVFGVPVVATADTHDRKLLHAAHVLAQYIDNDENGEPDDPRVLAALVEHGAFLAMTATEEAMEHLELRWEALERAGFEIGQDLYGEETLPAGPPHARSAGRFDATLEEVLHLVSFGWERAYPEVFGFEPGSRLADAMDRARGGRLARVPDRYADSAWYHYHDETCDYGCQVAEYFYWALTSLLGGQDYPGRPAEIADEWELPTAELLAEGDPAVHVLLTDGRWRLPRVLPDGGYRR